MVTKYRVPPPVHRQYLFNVFQKEEQRVSGRQSHRDCFTWEIHFCVRSYVQIFFLLRYFDERHRVQFFGKPGQCWSYDRCLDRLTLGYRLACIWAQRTAGELSFDSIPPETLERGFSALPERLTAYGHRENTVVQEPAGQKSSKFCHLRERILEWETVLGCAECILVGQRECQICNARHESHGKALEPKNKSKKSTPPVALAESGQIEQPQLESKFQFGLELQIGSLLAGFKRSSEPKPGLGPAQVTSEGYATWSEGEISGELGGET